MRMTFECTAESANKLAGWLAREVMAEISITLSMR